MADYVESMHLSSAELDQVRRSPHVCDMTDCAGMAVAVAAVVNDNGTEIFPVCARHVRARWADERWRLVPLADLIGGAR